MYDQKSCSTYTGNLLSSIANYTTEITSSKWFYSPVCSPVRAPLYHSQPPVSRHAALFGLDAVDCPWYFPPVTGEQTGK